MLTENTPAPDFSLLDDTNTLHTLADYKGRWLVLFFYPKDFTPGCTVEVCSMRDGQEAILLETGAAIVGVSRDTIEDHQNFKNFHGLTFPLLSDPDAHTVQAYDAEGPTIYDAKHEVLRKTYLIDPTGIIRKIYPAVTPEGHAAEILADLKNLQS